MKLSSKVRYGVRAMFDVAFHGEGGAAQIKDIAERQAIPARFLEQIFQDLRRAGLVTSKRGPRGGYQLARTSAQISIGDVLRALEGPFNVVGSNDEVSAIPESGHGPSLAVTDEAFRDLSARIEAQLDAITLEELCERAEKQGVKRGNAGGYVYVI